MKTSKTNFTSYIDYCLNGNQTDIPNEKSIDGQEAAWSRQYMRHYRCMRHLLAIFSYIFLHNINQIEEYGMNKEERGHCHCDYRRWNVFATFDLVLVVIKLHGLTWRISFIRSYPCHRSECCDTKCHRFRVCDELAWLWVFGHKKVLWVFTCAEIKKCSVLPYFHWERRSVLYHFLSPFLYFNLVGHSLIFFFISNYYSENSLLDR